MFGSYHTMRKEKRRWNLTMVRELFVRTSDSARGNTGKVFEGCNNTKSGVKEKTMKTVSAVLLAGLAVLAAIVVFAPEAAEALTNAPAGTSIVNKASVNYSTGGVAQTVIESSPTGNATAGAGSGTNTSFLVDAKVNFKVTTVDVTNVPVYAGGPANTYYLTIRVTNWSNTGLDFSFTSINNATNPFTTAADVYDQAMGNFRVDANADCAYDAGDTGTYIDELAMSGNRCVFAFAGAIGTGQTYGDDSAKTIIVTANYNGTAAALGAAVASDSDGDNNGGTNGIDWELNDSGRNGYESSDSAFVYRIATLTVTKISTVISDPINGTSSPIAIPGAFIDYTITVSNAANSSPATDFKITDDLSAIVAPATGYGLYNTGSLRFYNGTSWNTMTDTSGDTDQGFYNTTLDDVEFSRFDLTNGATARGVFRIELQ